MRWRKGAAPLPKQKTALIASLCALVMIVMFGLSFWLSSQGYRSDSPGIVLPSEMETGAVVQDPDMAFQDENAGKIAEVKITPQNVQDVIATLSRPNAYSLAVTNTLYWDASGSATLQCRQYVREGAYRTETLDADGAVRQVTLQYGDALYAWDAGTSTYYTGHAGAFTPAETAMLPTYETVCTLPQEKIQEAGLIELAGQPMVRVLAEQDGQTAEYVVSTVTGLLYSATFAQDGVRTRAIQTSVLSLNPSDDAYFTLPGAQTTIYAS